jgi:hypothetical protein
MQRAAGRAPGPKRNMHTTEHDPKPLAERRPSAMRRAARGSILLALVAIGCSYPPSSFPVRSAASPEATAAPSPLVARAVMEEPPLPGQPLEGWSGLGAAPTSDPHAGHHMHHHTPSTEAPPDAR